jgi:hypothetical protein
VTERKHKIRIAVIGAGTISQSVHIESLRRAGFNVVYICDLSPSRAESVAKSVGAVASISPEEVFASDDVDAVLIATPGSHAELAASAIRAGKHVLAEKPLAFTIREVEELETLASKHGVVTQVGYMKMFDPLLSTVARELAEYRDLKLVRITVSHPADEPQVSHLRLSEDPRDADLESIEKAVAYDRARASEALPGASEEMLTYYSNVLNGSVIHEFSLLRALGFKLPSKWEAQILSPINGEKPPSLLASGRVGETAFLLSWNWLPEYPEYEEELVVLASNGRMTFHLAKPYVLEARSRLKSRRYEGNLRKDTEYTAGHETGFLLQLDSFAAAINTGVLNPATFMGVKADIAQLQVLAQAISASLGLEIGTEV